MEIMKEGMFHKIKFEKIIMGGTIIKKRLDKNHSVINGSQNNNINKQTIIEWFIYIITIIF
jgi:hypothetical protein